MKSQIVIVFEHQQDDTPVNLAAGIDRLLRTVEAESSKNFMVKNSSYRSFKNGSRIG